MDKKSEKLFAVAASAVLLIAGVIFSAFAGADVGTDIGGFIYNITH